VPQKTLVVHVPNDQCAALEARLAGEAFEFRSVPHARFSVKGAGAVATLYNSGKFVVQGADPEAFLARFTQLDILRSDAPQPDAVAALDQPTVGSDETGKGDYFGPLVVAAVRLEPAQARELEAARVIDSKQLSDTRALQLGAALRQSVDFALERLDPEAYNAEHARHGNLNPLLAQLHARAIERLAQPGDRVVVDQFGHESLVREALSRADLTLVQAHRAERNVAVAAASILARQEFLVCLRELSAEFELELRKGAGEPVDQAAAHFVRQHGRDALGRVAKLHFKNTQKIPS